MLPYGCLMDGIGIKQISTRTFSNYCLCEAAKFMRTNQANQKEIETNDNTSRHIQSWVPILTIPNTNVECKSSKQIAQIKHGPARLVSTSNLSTHLGLWPNSIPSIMGSLLIELMNLFSHLHDKGIVLFWISTQLIILALVVRTLHLEGLQL